MTHYDLCREEGNGALLSIDIHGSLTPDDLDLLLADIDAHPDEYGLDWDDERETHAAPYRGFNVTACVRRSVHPLECDNPDGEDCWHDWTEWVYDLVGSAGVPALHDGEVFVTRLEVDNTWRHRCYMHRHRVAACGLPAANFLPPGPDETPHPIIDGYLYMCRDCQASHQARMDATRTMWLAEVERRRAAGVPERLVFA